MKNKKFYLWIVCIICAGLCIGAVIGTYNLYKFVTENELTFSSVQSIPDSLELKNYILNVKIYHVYIFSAIATLMTGLIALFVAFYSPKIEKKSKQCSFKVNITDNFPYFNATNLEFYDFDENGIYQKSTSISPAYIYRLGIMPIDNPSEDTIIFVKHFRQQGQSDDVLGFLPMRLKWSYKDNVQNQNDRIIEKKIYPEVEQYCDFCFVKKSPNSKDYFLSLCGEYSGLTGRSICNCIFNSGIYEVDISVASNNSKKNCYRIEFIFTCVAHANNVHPAMFLLKSIKQI